MSEVYAAMAQKDTCIDEMKAELELLKSQVKDLQGERDTVQEESRKKTIRLALAEEENEEMRNQLREFRKAATPQPLELFRRSLKEQHNNHTKKLEAKIERLEGLNRILMSQNERTDDDVRERAACEPEIQETAAKLQGQLEVLEALCDETQKRCHDLESEKADLQDRLSKAEYALDQLAVANQLLDESDGGNFETSDVPSLPPSQLSEPKEDGEVEDFICEYMTGGTKRCLERFPTADVSVLAPFWSYYCI